MAVLELRSDQAPSDVGFLRGLNREEVDLILAAGKLQRFSAKRVMTYQGEPAGRLLLLWRGRARYFFETQNGKKQCGQKDMTGKSQRDNAQVHGGRPVDRGADLPI